MKMGNVTPQDILVQMDDPLTQENAESVMCLQLQGESLEALGENIQDAYSQMMQETLITLNFS